MGNQNNTLSVETPVYDDAIWVEAPGGMSVGRDTDIEDPAAMSGRGAFSEPSFDCRRWFAARRMGSGQFHPDPTRAGLSYNFGNGVLG